MSTKATIAYSEDFHFYHEVMDDDHVYLELETMNFEAGYGRVMLPIPIHIWETIRHLGGARLDLVNRTDAVLLAMVEADVDARIRRYQEALRTHPDRAGLMSLAGFLVYGSAEDSRMEQVARGMEYYRNERQHQREVEAAIRQLREAQRHTTQVLPHLNESQIAVDLLMLKLHQVWVDLSCYAPLAEHQEKEVERQPAERESALEEAHTSSLVRVPANISRHDLLHLVCIHRPTDFAPYGIRQRDASDCSGGCKHYIPLADDLGSDWGVCANPCSPRAGLLTFEHQGCEFFEYDERIDEESEPRDRNGNPRGSA